MSKPASPQMVKDFPKMCSYCAKPIEVGELAWVQTKTFMDTRGQALSIFHNACQVDAFVGEDNTDD